MGHHKSLEHIDIELVADQLDDVEAPLNSFLSIHVVLDRAVLSSHTADELVSGKSSTVADIKVFQASISLLDHTQVVPLYPESNALVLESSLKVISRHVVLVVMIPICLKRIIFTTTLFVVSSVVLEVLVQNCARFCGWHEDTQGAIDENRKDSCETTNVAKVVEHGVDFTLVVLTRR